MKCTICGDVITEGDEVVGLMQGNAETDEDGKLSVDVTEKVKTAHLSCFRDNLYTFPV